MGARTNGDIEPACMLVGVTIKIHDETHVMIDAKKSLIPFHHPHFWHSLFVQDTAMSLYQRIKWDTSRYPKMCQC